jgi:hypothetical protein
MDHTLVVREQMTERYLLDELDPEAKEKFEEHFFECPECAFDVHAGAQLLEQGKSIGFSLETKEEPVPVPHPPKPPWFGWLRPAFAVPVMAMLLALIGYQNFVTFPRQAQNANRLQLLPATTLNLSTYGLGAAPQEVRAGQDILLNVIIPPGRRYDTYKIDLHNPAGGVESVPISSSAEDTWSIRVPGASLQSGTYKLTVHGINSSGQNVEVGSTSFPLQIQK